MQNFECIRLLVPVLQPASPQTLINEKTVEKHKKMLFHKRFLQSLHLFLISTPHRLCLCLITIKVNGDAFPVQKMSGSGKIKVNFMPFRILRIFFLK
jgi:hypothetical protein